MKSLMWEILKKIRKYFYIIIPLVIIFIIVIGFWIFRKSFIGSVKEFSVFYSFIATGIIAYITFLYFLTTKELVQKNEELIKTTINIEIEKKKGMAKNLLLEIHDNNNMIRKIKTELDEINKTQTRLDPVTKPELYFIVFEHFIEKGIDIDFTNPDISPIIRSYYYKLKEFEESIIKYNLNCGICGIPFDKSNFLFMDANMQAIFALSIGEKLFNNLEKESGFEYSKKFYFSIYKKFSFEEITKLMSQKK